MNIRTSYDWGDDFAQYLHQAKNIIEGLPASDTGFIFENPVFGPPAYLSGFPLLLSPFVWIWGDNILAFQILMTSLLCCLGQILYIFYRRHFSMNASFFLVLLLLYNPFTVNFKREVLSDIPFAAIQFLAIILSVNYHQKKLTNSVAIGLCAGLLISFRAIGIVFPIAFLLHAVFQFFRSETSNSQKALVQQTAVVLFICLSVYTALNVLLFPVPQNGLLYYFGTVSFSDYVAKGLYTFPFYLRMFRNYFMSGVNVFPLLTWLTQGLIGLLFIIGFFNAIRKRCGLMEIYLLLYFAVLAVYYLAVPFVDVGMRYLFPILGILFYYASSVVSELRIEIRFRKRNLLPLAGLFFLVPYCFSLANIVRHQNETLPGPQEKCSKELFEYVITHTSQNAIFAFNYQRTLSLYTGRHGIRCPRQEDTTHLEERFKIAGVQYVILGAKMPNPGLETLISLKPKIFSREWENEQFKVFRYAPEN